MRSTARVWQNWWMQIVAGLLMTAVVVLPWLWIGKNDSAIFPHASNDMLGLLVVFSVLTLFSAYFVRRNARGAVKFAVLTDVGVALGLIGFVLQGLYAFNPKIFAGKISDASVHQLWVVGSAFVLCQILYFLLVRLPLGIVVLLTAALTTGISLWLTIVASLLGGAGEYGAYLNYAGPLVLGLALGILGFMKAVHLLMWLLALAIQWVMPAVFTALAALGSSSGRSFGSAAAGFANDVAANMDSSGWQIPTLVTLAAAMLTSVVLLIARKVRKHGH
ncbi:hypothetical protein AUR04nite_13820 [Glutamicibacter uratoxydans]|uniref:Uncharacterized protein n=2 Tax=Glutamicibacter uratoxydans TaxID=43667 RepID=A0A4Y4DQQ3_GLUUR|nr:hypothetical protein AUR04nite_13820 [Glutamicibacter uratoxydans]